MRICTTCGGEWDDDSRFCPADGSILRPADGAADLVGAVLAERYHVLERLGEGGMGAVYLAEHVKMGLKVAVKVMAPELAASRDAVARFNREAQNAARIRHHNVCAIHDFGETPDGLVYLAMEYVEGESLRELLQREGALPPQRAAAILMQCCDALRAAHDLDIVHRDLKPDNIMVMAGRGGADIVKVVDFGIAKATAPEAGQTVTRTGFIVGTPEYMSPEQIAGEDLDARSDTYSLALVLFKMLTGSMPFTADTPEETFAQRLTVEPLKLREAVSDAEFPPALQAVLDRALARSRTKRYPSTIEFGRAVENAVGEMPASSRAIDVEAETYVIDSSATPVRVAVPPRDAPASHTPETPQPIPGVGGGRKRQIPAALVGGAFVFGILGVTAGLLLRGGSGPESVPAGQVATTDTGAVSPAGAATAAATQPPAEAEPAESRWGAELPEIEALIDRGAYQTALERLDFLRGQDIFDRAVNALIVRAIRAEIAGMVNSTDHDGAIARLGLYLGERPYLEGLQGDLKALHLDRVRYRIAQPGPRELDPGWGAYRQLVEAFRYDADLRYRALLLLLGAGDVPAGSVLAILEIDSTLRGREPLRLYAREALDAEDWWNNGAAHELIGRYYFDGFASELVAALEAPDANRRLNAYEILRLYGPARLAQVDLYGYHRLNVTGIRAVLEIGNPQRPLRNMWEYLHRLDDESRIDQVVADLRALPPADLRYAFARAEVTQAIERLSSAVYPVDVTDSQDSLLVLSGRYSHEFLYTEHEAVLSEAEDFARRVSIAFTLDGERVADEGSVEPIRENPAPRLTCRAPEGDRPCTYEVTWRYRHPPAPAGDHRWSFRLTFADRVFERTGVVRIRSR